MLFNKIELMSIVIDRSHEAGIDPALSCSLVHAVSQWFPASINHAPSDLVPGFDMSPEESDGWQTTYGLFQFTGQQAREAGYKGKFPDLLDPSTNISLGIGLLRDSLRRTPRTEVGLIVYLGRGRAMMVPGIVSLVDAYQKLISERPEVVA